jgi:hypothetical protein
MMAWVLRSPLHRLLSGGMLLVTVTGRRSGRAYTLPVSYLQDGDLLLVTSMRHRSWWRNLRGGAVVAMWLAGRERRGWGEVLEEESQVAAGLLGFLRKMPHWSGFYGVRRDGGGQPIPEDVARTAQRTVIVRIDLADERAAHGSANQEEMNTHG